MKITTQYNFKPTKGIKVDKVSLTIPDQSLTINELFRKYSQGMDVPQNTGAAFLPEDADFDSPDMDELHRMDFSEKYEKLRTIKETMIDLTETIKSDLSAAEEAKANLEALSLEEPSEAISATEKTSE